MSRTTALQLESYRLAQYAAPTACYICGQDNTFDSELCRRCCAPMALAFQAASLKTPPAMAAICGSADAGKTVYLGMLTDILSQPSANTRLLARGAFTISLQQSTMTSLMHCRFPEKTPNEPDRWNWMHYQVQPAGRRRQLELIMPDMAGEALMEEINHPRSYPVVRAFLEKCGATLLLVDAARLAAGDKEQDFHTMKIISYLLELDGHPKRGWPQRPLGVIFSKADQCSDCFEDPEQFAKRNAPGLWRHCHERLKRHKFFATGVAGECTHRWDRGGRLHVPLRIEPRGIVEPFMWLLQQLK